MNCDLKAASFRSPWGFNTNSRGCSPDGIGTEPVVTRHPNHPNPAGVEQAFDDKSGAIYSTPTGSVKTTTFSNHGFRPVGPSPAAIIMMTPMGSGGGGDG
ncbi:MAG: hypothetical protein OEV87_03250 [Phycisphaerae bacterium]|nr:hypothetical protein [Phycisphaerae bacterium]